MLRAEQGLLVRTALHVKRTQRCGSCRFRMRHRTVRCSSAKTSGECAETRQVELIQVLLGRGDVYSDGQFELTAMARASRRGIGYLGRDSQTVDMNLS